MFIFWICHYSSSDQFFLWYSAILSLSSVLKHVASFRNHKLHHIVSRNSLLGRHRLRKQMVHHNESEESGRIQLWLQLNYELPHIVARNWAEPHDPIILHIPACPPQPPISCATGAMNWKQFADDFQCEINNGSSCRYNWIFFSATALLAWLLTRRRRGPRHLHCKTMDEEDLMYTNISGGMLGHPFFIDLLSVDP